MAMRKQSVTPIIPLLTILMTAAGEAIVLPSNLIKKIGIPGPSNNWKTSPAGLETLARAGRIIVSGNTLRYKRLFADFSAYPLISTWNDTTTFSQRIYVVQTNVKVVERCLLMTTDPGDLVLDPTCGSGTRTSFSGAVGKTMDYGRHQSCGSHSRPHSPHGGKIPILFLGGFP